MATPQQLKAQAHGRRRLDSFAFGCSLYVAYRLQMCAQQNGIDAIFTDDLDPGEPLCPVQRGSKSSLLGITKE
jgi:hypothetical protein